MEITTVPNTSHRPKVYCKLVRRIRRIVKLTQAQFGHVLGISSKAIQSYEQCWRPVPIRVVVQALTLLAVYRMRDGKVKPCWEIKPCSIGERNTCTSYTIGEGKFCWFVTPRHCFPKGRKGQPMLFPCPTCQVVLNLLDTR